MKTSLALVALLICQVLATPGLLSLLESRAPNKFSAPSSSERQILKTLKNQKTATVIVSFKQNNVLGLLKKVKTLNFAFRALKINAIYDALKKHADTTQANVLTLLYKLESEKPIAVRQLWISNEIAVKNADYSVVEQLLAMDEVADVREQEVIPLETKMDQTIYPHGEVQRAGEPWGIKAVNAPEAWANGNRGKGAVIGTIDTGVRGTHEALRGNYRADRGWFDPDRGTTEPNDQNGHGTHTAGTIVGQIYGIGVAPEAQWISCKGCTDNGCSEANVKACGQFMLCPTDPYGNNKDCSKAPNAVSNSWGGGQGSSNYAEMLAAWKTVEIAPIFSIGNNGRRGCGTATSPGDYLDAIGVGSITERNDISDFSSVGPTVVGNRVKPEVAAPGSRILSAYHLSDNCYATISGTSMACPHVAGLSALLYSEKPDLTVNQLTSALISGAQQVKPSGANCGGIPETKYPNNHAGYGLINALVSLDNVRQM